MTRDEVRAVLLDWLESERVRYLELAKSLGVPPSIPIPEQVATQVTETGAQWRERERFVSPVGTWTVAEARLTFADHERGGPPEPTATLHEHYGDKCRTWGTGFPVAAEPDTRQMAATLLRRTCGDYLSQLESLEKPAAMLAASLVDGLLRLVEADRVLFVTVLPVAGLRPTADTLECDGVTVRRLTNEEIGSLLEPLRPERRFSGRRIAIHMREHAAERCALIVRAPCPKTQQPHSYRAHAVVLALQLLGFELRGRRDAATYTEPGPSLWEGGQGIGLADYGGSIRDFTLEDLKATVELAALLPEETFKGGPKNREAIALHRFRSAACESYPGDALIDYVTALEAALLPADGELSFRLGVYGARYLEVEPARRRSAFEDLRELYNVRSGLVHGSGGWDDPGQLEALRTKARDLTGRILVKALREGWPTPKQLKDLALS